MRNRQSRQSRQSRWQKNQYVDWKSIGGGLIILMIIAEVMMIYFVSPMFVAGASPMIHTLSKQDQYSTRRSSQSSCTIAQTQACASALLVATPTPTHVPRTLSGAIYSPIVNGGNSVVGIKDRNQTISFSFETDIIDNRGSGAGWKVSESTTALKFGTNGSTSDLFLDALKPSVVTCMTNSNCSSTSAIALAPLGQDMVPGPVTLVDAPFATGIGSFAITILGYFIIPASATTGLTTGGVITITIFDAP